MEHLEQSPADIIHQLTPFLSPERLTRLTDVVSRRTATVVTVIEGLINLGNVSAVMRSAEALGFHKFHIIEGDAAFKNSQRTSQGADKWLDVAKWSTPAACIPALQAQGYHVVATHLDETAVDISEIDFTKPTALVFGNEADGVSDELLTLADQRCIIPMAGFVQSFNISVAAAVALYHAYHDRVSRQGFHGDLDDAAREALLASYCYRSVNHADDILLKIREG